MGHGGDERLIHHNVQSMGDGCGTEFKVRKRRRSKDHQIQIPGEGEHVLGGVYDPCLRVEPPGFGLALRICCDNDVKGVVRVRFDQRRVEHLARDAKSDDGGSDGCRCWLAHHRSPAHYSTSERKR